MSRLTVFVLAVFTLTISVRCLAEPLDDSESMLSRKDESDNVDSDPEDLDRSASAQAYASVNNRLRPGAYQPGSYPPTKMRLVECYACTDCPKVLDNTTSKYCPYTNDPTKNNKCIVYAEKYKQMDKPWYIRGCASERGSCADITKGHENTSPRLVKLLNCHECDGDRCNSNGVHRSLPDLTSAILFIIITPLIGKYTLSS